MSVTPIRPGVASASNDAITEAFAHALADFRETHGKEPECMVLCLIADGDDAVHHGTHRWTSDDAKISRGMAHGLALSSLLNAMR